MKLGIIGLPRSGKTTVFNALTRREGESAPPGGQVVPVLGVVPLPDPRVDHLSALYKPKKTIHAQVTYLDLQGMPGAAESRAEYMQTLLTHMRAMDAVLLVVRNFEEPSLGPPDPARDFRELEDEFVLADLVTVEKRLERIAADLKKKGGTGGVERELLEEAQRLLTEGHPLRTRPEIALAPELRGFTFLSGKPLLVVSNNAEGDEAPPPIPHSPLLVVRGKLEMELAQLPPEEAEGFMRDFGIAESALARVIRESFSLLRLATFLTVGEDEVRAWTIPEGCPAVEAAGVVHSDIKRGFIRAEVISYEDFRRAGDMAAAKKLGLVRLEGKTYPMKDGDIVNFRFSV